ncbi:MAG TPA: peptidoglycan DD-metalloendopeptidase family protein [Thermoanaerobaculia bacterium]|nr:peptidoglycan DD-metalloendopeptidase family protein [Thermoanaerobaculia bacterium]
MNRLKETAEKKTNWAVITAGLGGFVLGALTVLFIVWAYSGFRTEDGLPAASPEQAPEQAEVRPVPPASRPVPTPAPGSPTGPGRPWVQPAPIEGAPQAEVRPAPLPPSPELLQRNLVLPVQGIRPEQLLNTFEDARGGGRVHEAIDIMAARNTPVLAVEDGRIAKLFTSKQGGLTIYQFDPAEKYAYYYAHLERYADGVKEGGMLKRGQVLGYVGTSGNAGPDNPHLHFAIFRLTPEKKWWEGAPVNPFQVLGGRRGSDRVEPAR